MPNHLATRDSRAQRRSSLAGRVASGGVAAVGAALLFASPVTASPVHNAPVPVYAQSPSADAIDNKYTEVGGSSSPLGNPAGEVTPEGDGASRNYQGGTIFYSESTGAHVAFGVILEKYRELDGPAGDFGFPTTDESDAPGGGRVSEFSAPEGAEIYWTQQAGAWPVRGAVLAAYKQLGGPAGELGGPTEAQTESNGEFVQKFSGANGTGEVRWSPSAGFSTVPAALASQLTNVQIPEAAQGAGADVQSGGGEASGTAPSGSAQVGADADATDSSAAVNADDADDNNGSSFWKWLIPLLIALLLLALLWLLWKSLRGRRDGRPSPDSPRVAAPDVRSPRVNAPNVNGPNVDAPDAGTDGGLDWKKGAIGGAAVAGAAGLGAKATGAVDRDVDAPDVTTPDIDTPVVDAPDVTAPKPEVGGRPESLSIDTPDVDPPDADTDGGLDWKKGAIGGAAVAGAAGLGAKATGAVDRDVDAPDVAAPDSTTPDVAAPDLTTPDVAAPEFETPVVNEPDLTAPKPEVGGRSESLNVDTPEVEATEDDGGLDWKKGAVGGAAAAGVAGVGAKASGVFDRDSDDPEESSGRHGLRSDTADADIPKVETPDAGVSGRHGLPDSAVSEDGSSAGAAGLGAAAGAVGSADESDDDDRHEPRLGGPQSAGVDTKSGVIGGAVAAGAAGAAGLGATASGVFDEDTDTDLSGGGSAPIGTGSAPAEGAASGAETGSAAGGGAPPAWVNKKVVGSDSKLESLFDGLAGTDEINTTYAEVITSTATSAVAGQSFLVDENLSPKVAGLLRDAGYDAIHVHDADLSGGNNEQVLAKAKTDGRTLITGELSYVDDLIGGDTSPSLLLLRRGGATIDEQGSVIVSSLPHVAPVLSGGALVALAAERIRARRLPLTRG